jgi:hypothetical protein
MRLALAVRVMWSRFGAMLPNHQKLGWTADLVLANHDGIGLGMGKVYCSKSVIIINI